LCFSFCGSGPSKAEGKDKTGFFISANFFPQIAKKNIFLIFVSFFGNVDRISEPNAHALRYIRTWAHRCLGAHDQRKSYSPSGQIFQGRISRIATHLQAKKKPDQMSGLD
jgi:hypothetical protein